MRYRRELASEAGTAHIRRLAALGQKGTVTLLFAARDEQHNSANVLFDVLAAHRGLRA